MEQQTKEKTPSPCAQDCLILVVDDEQDIRDLLRILLEKEGYRVAKAAHGLEAVEYVKDHKDEVSLVVMDIVMPVMDGIEASTKIREMTDVPILFLTARSSDGDKIAAYHSGGDDYIIKPFRAIDLCLKISAMLNRFLMYREQKNAAEQAENESSTVYRLDGDIEVHADKKEVFKNGRRINLTDREVELLVFFCQNKHQVLTPTTLYEEVWGEPYLSTASNTVIVHIANLRKKLEQETSGTAFIRTVWGKGYRLD